LAACGPRERVAVAEGVEHLAAHAASRVGAEGRAAIAAVPPRRLDQTDDAPCDEVLAVVPATARIQRPRGDGPREREVRDDALVARRFRQRSPPAADPTQVRE